MTRHSENYLAGAGNLALYYQCWRPETKSRGIIAVIHGIAGHSGQFASLPGYLVPRGYGVYGLDLRGHGRSEGQRGHIGRWDEYRQDVFTFLRFIKQEEPDTPIFLYGHSLGGVIVLDCALRCPFDLAGVITSAAALGEVDVPAWQLQASKIVSVIWPRFSIKAADDMAKTSRDPATVAARTADPLSPHKATARLGTEYQKTVAWVRANAPYLKRPLIMFHGSADQLASPEGSRDFYQRVKFPDKAYFEYSGALHELHEELMTAEMMVDLLTWLDGHCGETVDPVG